MADLPRLEDSQPVLNAQHINSEAEGLEAFTKALGAISQTSGNIAVELEKDQSQTMYVHSVSNLEQLKTTSAMRMLEHPDQAPKIADDMRNAADTVKKMAYVNSKDRERLNAYAEDLQNSVDLKATELKIDQTRREAGFNHWLSWPDQLKSYADSLNKNPEMAESLQKGMVSSIRGLVLTHAITPEQAATCLNMMHGTVEQSKRYHEYLGRDDVTARDYHKLASNPFSPRSDLASSPADHNSLWHIDYLNSDKDFQTALANTYNHVEVPPDVLASFKPNQQRRLIQTHEGVSDADALIHSGSPYTTIENEHKVLSESGKVLSYRDQAKKNALGVFMADLKDGNYMDAIGRTVPGAKMMRQFGSDISAIDSLPVDNQQKAKLLTEQKNNLVTSAVAVGQGLHIPSEYIRPIPMQDFANLESGFKLGGDPAQTLETLGSYSKNNQVFVANSMKNPQQRLIMQAVGYADNVTPQSKLDLITANQEGRQFPLDFKTHSVKEESLKNSAYSSLSDQLRFMGKQYDPDQAQLLQSGMIASTIKYAKYLAAKDNNLAPTTSQMEGYVKQASKIYQESFKQVSGLNYTVNANQIPGHLGKPELDHLAEYITNKAYETLKSGRSEGEFLAALRSNPLIMTFSPTNDVQAVDANGTVYFSTPYNEHLLSAAIFEKNKRRKEAEEKPKEPSNLLMGINNAD